MYLFKLFFLCLNFLCRLWVINTYMYLCYEHMLNVKKKYKSETYILKEKQSELNNRFCKCNCLITYYYLWLRYYCLNILSLPDREIFLENHVNTLEKELDICRGRLHWCTLVFNHSLSSFYSYCLRYQKSSTSNIVCKYSIKGDCAGNKNESYVYIHRIP